MKETFIFLITFYLFPIYKPLPIYFYLLFFLLIFLKSEKRKYLFFFASGIICKALILSYIPQKEVDLFEGKIISFPYESDYGVSLLAVWKNYGIAPINIQNYDDKLPSIGSFIKVRAERILMEKSPKPLSNRYNFYLKIKDTSQIEKIKSNTLNKIIYFPAKLNDFFYQKTNIILKNFPILKSFTKTLIFARYSLEDEDFFEVFQMAGIVHILSISGLHIGIFIFYFLIILRFLKIPPSFIYIFSIFFLLFFSSFCGFRAPVLRASLMLSLYFFFLLIHRPLSFEKTLYLSLPLNGLIMPNQISTPGFFLSYLSTYILIKTAPYFENKLKGIFISSFYVQIFIQPFLLYSFGILNWQAILLNPILIPFAFIFLLFSPLFFLFPSEVFLKVMNFLSSFVFGIVQNTKDLIWWGSFLPYMPLFLVLTYYFISIYYIEKSISKGKGKILFLIFLLIFSIYLLSLKVPKNEIIFLNVGQGSATLIKDNFENILIDTGKRSYFAWLLPSLLKENVNYLSILILTHPDEDHDRCALKIIDTIPLGSIAFPEIFKENYKEIIKKAEEKKIKTFYLKKGSFFNTRNLQFNVLSPENKYYNDFNEASLVLEINSKNKSFLIMGDATKKIEIEILKFLNKKPFVLLTGHHGSKSSTSLKFLNLIKPRIAVISVGRRNPYNHPSKEVIKSLKEENILILRTDQRGSIKIDF